MCFFEDHSPRFGSAKRPRRSQQALQDSGLRDVEDSERCRGSDRNAAGTKRPADQMDGTGIARLLALHKENRRLELRYSHVGNRHIR